MRRLRPLLLLAALAAACAGPPAEPGERWKLWTATGGAAELPAGEFAVLAFGDPRATPGAGTAVADALASALRDRGRATLSREWAAENLPAEGVVVVRGELLRWREDVERGWLTAEVAFSLSAGGEERLRGSLDYEILLAPAAAEAPAEARRDALRAALASVLAEELLAKLG